MANIGTLSCSLFFSALALSARAEEPHGGVDAVRVQFVTGCLSRLIVTGALSACQCKPGYT
jgi:hypothetical protein